ncbi:NAD-dependent epimerase/dehydratase family protein [Cellulomonas sp. P22]|uniref:NAD-dependent epimerase/dehydratase family protein n=1 Tax=Cellulomonas sp. P22 TaxID=3373189 RepID=UPI0037B47E96
MVQGEVRSGRSRAKTDDEGGHDVVVVGLGPVAAGVAAWLSEHGSDPVRMLDHVPSEAGAAALAGTRAVVFVAHSGNLAETLAVPAGRRRTDAVADAERLLAAARTARVGHVVAVSSAMVLGARPGQGPLGDDAPLVDPVDGLGDGAVGDLLAVEAVLARAARRRGGPRVAVLRPAPLVGPGIDTLVTRHFEAPRLLTVRGTEREWQLLHVDDLGAAVGVVLDHGLRGPLTVGSTDVLTAREVEVAAGMRRIELAAVTAFGTAERLHRVGVLPAPASELAYTVYPWTVTSSALLAAGWVPRWPAAACLDVLLEGVQGRTALGGRRVGARDAAALGAAGAAVAAIGTAAVWRQARARRRR